MNIQDFKKTGNVIGGCLLILTAFVLPIWVMHFEIIQKIVMISFGIVLAGLAVFFIYIVFASIVHSEKEEGEWGCLVSSIAWGVLFLITYLLIKCGNILEMPYN